MDGHRSNGVFADDMKELPKNELPKNELPLKWCWAPP